MGFKLKEIIARVNGDLEEDADAADIVAWVNLCLNDVTPIAKKEAPVAPFAITAANSYDLPADFHKEAIVLVNGDEYDEVSIRNRDSQGYRKWAGKLSLQGGPDSGTIELLYFRKLTPMSTTAMDIEPDLESEFHDLPILYATGMLQFREEEYDRPDALKKYLSRKEEYRMFIESRQAPMSWKVE